MLFKGRLDNKEQGIEVYYKDDILWVTQKAMSALFDCSPDDISLHLKYIFKDGELNKSSVTEKYSATASDGKNYMTNFYNLDAVISMGYKVNNTWATQFRQWATAVLRQFAIRGYMVEKSVWKFLSSDDKPLLSDKGSVSANQAKEFAES